MVEKKLFLDLVILHQQKGFVFRIENLCSSTSFRVRFREHVNSTRASTTAVGDHLRNTRHVLDLSSSLVVVRENDTFKRRIREAIEIHCQAPTLNRDVGYELPAIYWDVLSRDILST